jgi:extradiol dioxygenase family protein
VENVQQLANKLEQAGVDFTTSKSGRAALFCRDHDRNVLEFCELP